MNRLRWTTWQSRRPAVWVLSIALLVGCDLPGKPNPADRPVMPDQILDFGQLYQTNCAACHGADGQLGPAPPLNDPLFAAIVPDAELSRVVREGRPGTPMPAFLQKYGGSLTAKQVEVLAKGIKSFWPADGQADDTQPAYLLTRSESVTSTPGSRERGAQVFARACAGCHGTNGAGKPGNGSRGGAINVPAFLALISDQALRRIIITGRPDLGMPTYAETAGRAADFQPLTAADVDDLVALLRDWRATDNVVARSDH